jgi:serine/threonine-protein kinase HipA
MRSAEVYQHDVLAGYLREIGQSKYLFEYRTEYSGPPVSLTMPTNKKEFEFDGFPPLFEGLLPEGEQLEALLRREKLDAKDLMGQLLAVGKDVVGSLVIKPTTDPGAIDTDA